MPNRAEKRSARSTPSGRNGPSALGRVVAEPRRESESAFKAVQRRVRGWDPLKRLRIATQASVLLGQTGPNGRLAPRLAEVAARGERELAWQLELWEVSSVQDPVTSSRSAAWNRVPFGRNGRSGPLALAVAEEGKPPRGENAFCRDQKRVNSDARGSR